MRLTGNTRLMKLHGGENITIKRTVNEGETANGLPAAATNPGCGLIRMGDSSFSYREGTMSIVVHEIAHNWDESSENPDFYSFSRQSDWRGRSAWEWFTGKSGGSGYNTSADGWHYYRATAEFARDYGRVNPKEDWATCWELYWWARRGDSPIGLADANYIRLADKMSVIDAFFAKMRAT